MSVFNNLVVVITGASSGFGKGIARCLAEKGANLVLAARREELLDELAEECQCKGVRAFSVPTDVCQIGDVQQLCDAAVRAFGHIDVWINDAGVCSIGEFTDIPPVVHRQVIDTNLTGTINGCFFAMNQFKTQERGGKVINIASGFGNVPSPLYASYVASKYGVMGLSKALRQEMQELKLDKIKITTISPLANDTPFFEHGANYTGQEVIPPKPLYDPQRVVDAVIDAIENDKDDVMVGGRSKMLEFLHRMVPGVMEKISAVNTMSAGADAPPQPPTEGNVFKPVPFGTEMRGKHGGTTEGRLGA
jgi:short-subunit dehydrogenase